jgi:hypothetical protein
MIRNRHSQYLVVRRGLGPSGGGKYRLKHRSARALICTGLLVALALWSISSLGLPWTGPTPERRLRVPRLIAPPHQPNNVILTVMPDVPEGDDPGTPVTPFVILATPHT